MRLSLDRIQDTDLFEFLTILRRHNLNDIVVVGGAVRDVLLGRLCRDIDIAIRIPLVAPRHVKKFYSEKGCYCATSSQSGTVRYAS
jgi:tRNA nucleotidyltransferase/poly(A) polymerase